MEALYLEKKMMNQDSFDSSDDSKHCLPLQTRDETIVEVFGLLLMSMFFG